MKKQLSLAALAVLGLSSITSAAQPLLNLDTVFGGKFDFGYTDNQNITVQGFQTEAENAEKTFVITTPFLKDAVDANVESYSVLLSQNLISEYTNGTRKAELIDFSEIEYKPTTEDRMLGEYTIKIPATDLDVSTNYHGILVPMDDNIQEGKPSTPFCFNFETERYGVAEECTHFGQVTPEITNIENTTEYAGEVEETIEEEHDAAGADMRLADISHTINTNTITLSWTALPQSANVEIWIFNKEQGEYVSLATVPMQQAKFEYAIDPQTQEYLFAFIPRDAKGKEVRYSVNARQETTVTPEITVTPQVGPVEDMLLMIGITLALYAGYRVVSRKAN
ncbi:MAG: hypothetical protein Q4B28_00135 [bacterium]|nr:hypothetical protein [bacterium]